MFIRYLKYFTRYLILLVTVYNCPNTETYQARWSWARYEFYWPDIFRIRTIVHCNKFILILQPNLIYLMFSILGQYEFIMILNPYNHVSHLSVFHGICNLSWFCLHISPLTPFFFILSQRCKGDAGNSNWLNKILHWNLLGQYQYCEI